MSAHWYWDWDWQRDGNPATQPAAYAPLAGERVAEAPKDKEPGPTAHHEKHQHNDDVPIFKNNFARPCVKECRYIQTGAEPPHGTPMPDHHMDWVLFRLREVDGSDLAINDHCQDEWYWVRCKARRGCCKKGVVMLKMRVELLKRLPDGSSVYINDLKCRCLEGDDVADVAKP